MAWNDQVLGGQVFHRNNYAITMQFTSKHNGDQWVLTNIYGPCEQQERHLFINWLKKIHIDDDVNWILLGGSNYIRYPHNRSRAGGNLDDMFSFNEAINQQALVEIPLKGGKYTWSNMQEALCLRN